MKVNYFGGFSLSLGKECEKKNIYLFFFGHAAWLVES